MLSVHKTKSGANKYMQKDKDYKREEFNKRHPNREEFNLKFEDHSGDWMVECIEIRE